ncbi:hypothetical protein MHIMP23_11490 [Methylobacterium hispanicum]
MSEARLLTVEAMRTVDATAIAGGTPGLRLMERAGGAVAERARALAPPSPSALRPRPSTARPSTRPSRRRRPSPAARRRRASRARRASRCS